MFAITPCTSDGATDKQDIQGIVIFQKICHLFAPSMRALSSWSVGIFIRIPVADNI